MSQDRKRREYWVSCCADRIGSIGAKAWRSSSASAQRVVDRGGNRVGQPRQDALAGALAQRHGLDRGLHHVLGPAEGEGQQRVAHRRAGARGGEGEGDRLGRRGLQRGEHARAASACRGLAATRRSERPICSVCRRNSAVSRVCEHPGVERGDARAGRRAARRRWPGATTARSPRARLRCSWSSQPVRRPALRRSTQAAFDRRLQPFGVAEAADRQGRRGQPDQLQQAGGGGRCGASASVRVAVRGRGRACSRGRARGRAPWSCAWPCAWPCARIGAAFGLERRRCLASRSGASARSMSASTWSGSIFRWSGLQLDRHMAVAQVVGRAQSGRTACRARRNACTTSTGCGAAITRTSEPSSATSTSPPRTTRAARQEHAERAALRVGGVEAALLAHVPVEFDGGGALEQHRREAAALGHEFVDGQHGAGGEAQIRSLARPGGALRSDRLNENRCC